MKIRVLGSGGSIPTPRPFCRCPICTQARKEQGRYVRKGQSMYLPEIHALFDMPESIVQLLNEQCIWDVDHIFFSHFHPDHTLGARAIEQRMAERYQPLEPVAVHLPESGLQIGINYYASLLDFYHDEGFCTLDQAPDISIGQYCISRIPLNNGFADGFLITDDTHRVFYCPCHVGDLSLTCDVLHGCDLMILGSGGIRQSWEGETSFYDHVLPVIRQYAPKQTVITHLEEFEQYSYDDYCQLEQTLAEYRLRFAYDGMEIIL